MEELTNAPAPRLEEASSDVTQETSNPIQNYPRPPAPVVSGLKAAIVAGKPAAPAVKIRVIPKALLDKMVTGTTLELADDSAPKKFSCLIYGDTNSHKTTLAATYGTPRDLMIISTRNPEQLIPLVEDDYFYVFVRDEEELEAAITFYPEFWEAERKRNPDRRDALQTVVIDDLTEGVGLFQEGNKIDDNGRIVKDVRRTWYGAGDDVSRLINRGILRDQQVDLICTALQRESKNKTGSGIEIVPDIPPSMRAKIEADFSNVFYINGDHAFVTDKTKKIVLTEDPKTGKFDMAIEVRTFAKHKHPFRRKALELVEKLTLRQLADKIEASFKAVSKPAVVATVVKTGSVTKTVVGASNKK